jgi:hypothetical protein
MIESPGRHGGASSRQGTLRAGRGGALLLALCAIFVGAGGARAGDARFTAPSPNQPLLPDLDFHPGEMRSVHRDPLGLESVRGGRLYDAEGAGSLHGSQRSASWSPEATGEKPPGYLVPVLLSAAVPGAGELKMGGTKRAIAFFAAEVFGWWQVFRNRADGLDERDAYESFADEHWSIRDWFINNLGYPPDNLTEEEINAAIEEECFQWQPRNEDKQHYYENIGKYECFVFGWDDYRDASPDYTYHRDIYRAMRSSSNHDLNQARNYLAFNIVTRLVSMVDTAFMVRSRRRAYEEERADAGLQWRAWCKYKMKGPMVGFTVTFN